MERKGLVIVVILLLTGFIFLWNHNSSGDRKNTTANAASELPSKQAVHSGHGRLRWRNQDVVEITANSPLKNVFSVKVSTEGAALRSVELHADQYRRKERLENAPAFLEKSLVEAGDYELVNVHKVSQLPFQFVIEKPDKNKSAPRLERVIRKDSRVELVPNQPNQLRFSDRMGPGDLYIRKGDVLTAGNLQMQVSSIVKTEKTGPGTARTEVYQVISLSKPVPTPPPSRVDVIRRGDIFTQYAADSRYSCVDCVSGEGESSILRPSKPNGKVTLVWPNPKRDKSDIWIERTWQVVDEYRLQHTSNIINLGFESFEIKPSITVTGWVDPKSVDVGMFSARMKPLSPACVVNDDFEEETAPELDNMEEEGEDVQLQGDIRWFGVNAQYFLMAALFSEDQGKGTCTMWADRMAPVARTLLKKLDKLETDGIDPFDDWYFDNLKQRLFPSWYWFGTPSEEIQEWLVQEEQREAEREDFANGYDIQTSFSPQWRSVDPWGVKASNEDSPNSEERVLVCVPSWLAGGRTMATIKGSIQTCDDAKKEQAGLETKRNQLGHSLTDPADTERVKHLNRVLPQYKKREKERLLAMTVFAGPKDLQLLEETSPALANSLDFWFVGFIAQPMLSFLRFTHRFVDSWALAIIILTVLVKLLLLPLTHKSFTQMQRMQQLKPEMDALRKKFKDDKKKQQVEMMNLYKRHRINPLGGCLPMMLQMPVYIALYRTIYSSVDLYQQPLFLDAWIPDMTLPDPLFILPIALGLFMVVQQMLSPMGAGGDEMQQKIIKWMMPIMFAGFMLFLPSGLVLYIFVNTFLTIIQQWMIRRKIAAKAG